MPYQRVKCPECQAMLTLQGIYFVLSHLPFQESYMEISTGTESTFQCPVCRFRFPAQTPPVVHTAVAVQGPADMAKLQAENSSAQVL